LNGLTPEQGKAVVAAARRQLGKPNDFFLRKSWEQLYSSELVRLAFSDVGVDVGRPQKMNRVADDLGMVRSYFMREWSTDEDCHRRNLSQDQCWAALTKQEVVTPSSIVNDNRMTKVFEVAKAEKKGFTLSRANEKKEPATAP
jgi:hypothetical protein